jgi:hypothetical protein
MMMSTEGDGSMARRDPYSFFLKSLRTLVEKYEGQYVAVVGAKVVAYGRDGKKVYDRARSTHPGSKILLAQVPGKEAMVLWLVLVSHSPSKNLRLSAT